MIRFPRLAAASLALTLVLAAQAQDAGTWRADSSTARSVTGDIFISEEKLMINFATFTVAPIRHLKPEEINSVFNAEATEPGGNLYRLNIPADKKFLHKNTLCGAEPVTFMATYAVGKNLQLAFFSGAAIPKMDPEAMANTTSLCGTYTYR